MHRSLITLTSVLALLVGFTSYGTQPAAHDGDKSCNVLLDGDGEPVKESDDDSIDHSNSHPCGSHDDSASDAQSSVEEVAEEDVANVVQETVTVEPMTVYFDSGQDELSAGAKAQVQAFAEQVSATNPTSIQVIGYTDTSGSPALNEKLSKARASNVMASLVDAGIASDIIEQGGAGEDTLAVTTPDGTREADNRRVVITPEY